ASSAALAAAILLAATLLSSEPSRSVPAAERADLASSARPAVVTARALEAPADADVQDPTPRPTVLATAPRREPTPETTKQHDTRTTKLRDATTRDAAPRDATTRDAAPRDATTRDAAPRDATTRGAAQASSLARAEGEASRAWVERLVQRARSLREGSEAGTARRDEVDRILVELMRLRASRSLDRELPAVERLAGELGRIE
ncbi:hypothetical protein L6R52_25165, partial [Myxococcota bacterium]|nr:hypothetical protein [Myxococcota bacterium]